MTGVHPVHILYHQHNYLTIMLMSVSFYSCMYDTRYHILPHNRILFNFFKKPQYLVITSGGFYFRHFTLYGSKHFFRGE